MTALPITNLSMPKNTALVVIDLQKGIASRQTFPHNSEKVVENAAKLAEIFRSKNMPVFLVHVSANVHERLQQPSDESFVLPPTLPTDWAEFMPQLKIHPNDIIITKKTMGCLLWY